MSTTDRAPRLVLACFALAAVCAVGFAVSYAADLGNVALGGFLGAAFAFLALGLARWASLIDIAEETYVEERAVGPTPRPEYESFKEALAAQPVPRSRVLWGGLSLTVTAIGGAALFPLRSLMPSMGTDPDRVLSQTAWRDGLRLVTEDGTPIHASDLVVGAILTAFPEGIVPREHVDTTTVLIRLDLADLHLRADRETWTVGGVVAYSKLCTHAGCPVGLYADDSRQLMCPCHHSIFDATDGASPVEGPAPHALPQLPLGVDDNGYLISRGDFDAPVGPGWWGY